MLIITSIIVMVNHLRQSPFPPDKHHNLTIAANNQREISAKEFPLFRTGCLHAIVNGIDDHGVTVLVMLIMNI